MSQRQDPVEAKLKYLFQRCLTRPPLESELTLLHQYYQLQRGYLEQHVPEAQQVAGMDGPESVEVAVWTLVARSAFNLDEFITKE